MPITDLFKEASSALFINKMRSGLTVLGIIIGIGSVIAMISIGQGAQASIESSIESLGSNLLILMPGAQRGIGSQISAGRGSAQSLTSADAEAIKKEVVLVKDIASEVSGRYQVVAKGANTNTQIVGTTASYSAIRNVEVSEGVFISDYNNKSLSRVAVLGSTVRDDLFGENFNPLGQTIRIKGINFTIIGITKPKGVAGISTQSDMIFVPLSTAQHFLSGNQYLTTVSIQVINQNSMAEAQEQITSLLLNRHHISDPQKADFSIMNQADILESASSIINTFTIFLGSVAGISLLVGGIGIMNMMLTTVTERTREIGLRKALGAKKRDIILQFLVESIMLTFVGGIFGIFLGWLTSLGISRFSIITTKVSFFSILLGCGVSTLIGIIFGYYPAKKAADLNPIEALRYE
ncbi:MAG: ABC transporter permease [Candidatus Pacebacteria bacterium]|nr:ABC transporter permease [Candidatus Paceibacterota bacterium]